MTLDIIIDWIGDQVSKLDRWEQKEALAKEGEGAVQVGGTAYGATTVWPSASVSRRSRGNVGRLEASHTAPYVFFRGAKEVSCALRSIVCQCPPV